MTRKFFFFSVFLLCLSIHRAAAQSSLITKDKFNLDKIDEDKIGYAQAVKVGNTLYISGSTGWGNMDDALKRAYDDLSKTLKHFNASFGNVVKENVYALSIDSLIKYKDVRRNYYGNDFPAATWVEVKRLYDPREVVEVELVVVLAEKKSSR